VAAHTWLLYLPRRRGVLTPTIPSTALPTVRLDNVQKFDAGSRTLLPIAYRLSMALRATGLPQRSPGLQLATVRRAAALKHRRLAFEYVCRDGELLRQRNAYPLWYAAAKTDRLPPPVRILIIHSPDIPLSYTPLPTFSACAATHCTTAGHLPL